MDNPLIVAVAITVAGMGLLFLALAFFYGLLTLISAALQERARPAREAAPEERAAPGQPAAAEETEAALQAAAIAVALARAQAEGAPARVPAGARPEPLSPWRALHEGRRMVAGSSPWRRS